MTIAVIRPSMFGTPASDRMMPLLFAILKPLTPPEITLRFYDERVRPLPETIDADVVAMTVETFAAKRAYQLADALRAQGKLVVMGGFHPSMLPEEAKAHADTVLCGDAEGTWPPFLRDLMAGTAKPFYRGTMEAPLTTRYDYSVFNKKDYPLVAPVQFGRGCKFQCDFCSIHAFYEDTVRFRPVEEVVKDIKKLPQKVLFFIDDNLFSRKEEAVALFRALVALKKKWVCQISMDVAQQPELLRLMRESGCIMAIIGFESLNGATLKQIKKSANLAVDYTQVIGNLYKAGLMIYGTFVVGYDGDVAETARLQMEFALKHKFAIANFNPLMPMPGTALYHRLAAENRLPHAKWWLDEGYRYGDAMLCPQSMTGQELLESCKQARYQFNSLGNILRRATNLKANGRTLANLMIFLVAGLVSRREIHNKQGRKLGKQG